MGAKKHVIKLEKLLDEDRLEHSISVERTAVRLAKRYGASLKKAALAGLLHDCAKWMSDAELLDAARQFKIRIDPFMKVQPKLLHSRISACLAKKYFGVSDKEVLSAIEHHTSGREAMSLLEEIIYIADHVEPGRQYKNAEQIRKLAFEDIKKAIALVASGMLQYLLDRDLPIYYETVLTRNYYLSHGRKN